MRPTLAVLILSGTLGAAGARADECKDTPAEVANCGPTLESANRAMLADLDRLMARLGDPGQRRLRKAQAAWRAYRDKQCDFQSSGNDATTAPLAASNCAEGLTEERLKQLEAALACTAGDLSCPR